MKTYPTQKGEKADYNQLITVWESAVKATHEFLTIEDFRMLRLSGSMKDLGLK